MAKLKLSSPYHLITCRPSLPYLSCGESAGKLNDMSFQFNQLKQVQQSRVNGYNYERAIRISNSRADWHSTVFNLVGNWHKRQRR